MKVSELKTGDIIAIDSPKGFLPPKIRFFLKKWAKKHYSVNLPRYYNHAMIYVNEATGEIAEAIGKGYVIHSFMEHYGSKLDRLVVFRLKEELTDEEKTKLYSEAIEMAKKNIPYEIFNFFWQMIYIISNGKVNLSPRGSIAGKKVFCFEAANLLLNFVRNLFKKPSLVNTVDLYMDDRFEKLFFTKIDLFIK